MNTLTYCDCLYYLSHVGLLDVNESPNVRRKEAQFCSSQNIWTLKASGDTSQTSMTPRGHQQFVRTASIVLSPRSSLLPTVSFVRVSCHRAEKLPAGLVSPGGRPVDISKRAVADDADLPRANSVPDPVARQQLQARPRVCEESRSRLRSADSLETHGLATRRDAPVCCTSNPSHTGVRRRSAAGAHLAGDSRPTASTLVPGPRPATGRCQTATSRRTPPHQHTPAPQYGGGACPTTSKSRQRTRPSVRT